MLSLFCGGGGGGGGAASVPARYLYFVEPLIDAATLETTKVAVQEFRVGAGPKLQHALVSKDDHHPETSYVAGAFSCVCVLVCGCVCSSVCCMLEHP